MGGRRLGRAAFGLVRLGSARFGVTRQRSVRLGSAPSLRVPAQLRP